MSKYVRRVFLIVLSPIIVTMIPMVSFISWVFNDYHPMHEGFEELFVKPWKG